ncbi:MAG: two-partner secretion domain-containing protein [Methylobacter sp.]
MVTKTSQIKPVIVILLLMLCRNGNTEVTLDGSLGSAGSVAPINGVNYQILPDYGQTAGSNLFHSFGQFKINFLQAATFYGLPAIDNVIARVTGGTPSTIDGLLISAIPGANFWLINPSGVLFGPHASINVDGSFYVSTANYLKFADGSIFGADQASAPVLTTAAPEAFGFLEGKQPAPINFEGSGSEQAENIFRLFGFNSGVKVPEGKTLSVIGGDIRIKGGNFRGTPVESRLQAPGGRINIASVASAGEVTIKPDGLDTAAFDQLGKIEIQGVLDRKSAINTSGDGGGAVFIRAGELVMDNSYVAALTFGAGNSGGIDIKATSLKLSNGAQIDASTYSTGKGGKLTITSHGDINISGPMGEDQNQTGIFSVTNDTGSGGSVSVTADDALTMDGSARILTRTLGTADAGSLNVKAGDITLTNGAQIFAGIGNTMKNNLIQGNSDGTGKGGDIIATVANILSISGHAALIPNFRSGIFSAGQIGRGDAGNISISAKTIELRNQGTISAFSGARSLGNAGNIVIREVDNLSLNGGSTIETEAIQADGGNIDVRARNLVFLRDSAITASVQSSIGKGGNIIIDPTFVILDNSKIIANAFGGPGGNIIIIADHFIASPDSIVDASSQRGINGTVNISSPDTNMIGKIATLTAKFLDPSTLFKAQCEARYSAGMSSLAVKVSNTVSPAPGEGYYMASPEPATSQSPSGRIKSAASCP